MKRMKNGPHSMAHAGQPIGSVRWLLGLWLPSSLAMAINDIELHFIDGDWLAN